MMVAKAFGAHEYEVAGVAALEVVCCKEATRVNSLMSFVQMGDNSPLVGCAITATVHFTLVGLATLGGW